MAQFRVEFLLDQASGKYLAEMYHPDRHDELLVRTEALYPSQAAAVLGVVQLFKDAMQQFPRSGETAARIEKRRKKVPGRKRAKKAARKSRKSGRAKKHR